MPGNNIENLKPEDEIDREANSRTGIFSNIRIANCEIQRFLIFGSMFFIIGFIYAFMRILKDMFVMERQDPACFNFIKIFYILPLSFAIVIGINYLLQSKTVSKIFTISLTIFALMFLVFGIVIFFEDTIMFDSSIIKDKFEDSNTLVKYFMFTLAEPLATLIYISAELWGSVILSYLFLSYLNESCSERQHSRFIPPLFILTSISLFTSAIVTTVMRHFIENLKGKERIAMMAGIFIVESGLVMSVLMLKYYLEKKVMVHPIFLPAQLKKSKNPKPRVSFKEGLQIMAQSKFLLGMCGFVFFYSVFANLLETVYKFGIKNAAKAKNVETAVLSARLNNYDQYITSITVVALNLTSFSNLTEKRGWTFVSLITPFMAFIGIFTIFGLGSYNSATEGDSFGFLNSMFDGRTAFYGLENYLGMLTMAGMKIFKYTAFDVTKERISMRIEDRYRPKFKSIYDGIFNKAGKSGGSVYNILIDALFADINPRGFSPITGALSIAFLVMWVSGIFYLGANYESSLKAKEPINIDLVSKEVETISEGEGINEVQEKFPKEVPLKTQK